MTPAMLRSICGAILGVDTPSVPDMAKIFGTAERTTRRILADGHVPYWLPGKLVNLLRAKKADLPAALEAEAEAIRDQVPVRLARLDEALRLLGEDA